METAYVGDNAKDGADCVFISPYFLLFSYWPKVDCNPREVPRFFALQEQLYAARDTRVSPNTWRCL